MAQRYAVQAELWRKKMRIREEGYRRPADAILSVQGVRVPEEHEAKHHPVYGRCAPRGPSRGRRGRSAFSVQCSGAAAERSRLNPI